LVRDFFWRPDPDLGVTIYQDRKAVSHGAAKFQLFEVLIATVMALLRPDYRWYVTPNRPDGGLDFYGRTTFLEVESLGIGAAITVGGQCKKRNRVKSIEEELGGSLIRMAREVNPTFFVIAFSANLSRSRIADARECLERSLLRHCHILGRRQIESLLRAHFRVLYPTISAALEPSETDVVQRYLSSEGPEESTSLQSELTVPEQVLAGEPFQIHIRFDEPTALRTPPRIMWKPNDDAGGQFPSDGITLLSPIGADSREGISLDQRNTDDGNPFSTSVSLEFVTHAVGLRGLGVVVVEGHSSETDTWRKEIPLPPIRVIENLCPRFYERPFRSVLYELNLALERASTGALATIAVTGHGGAGKSRVTQEFATEARRRGAAVVVAAGQTNNLECPRRILANLLLALASPYEANDDLAESVVARIAHYDAPLAVEARATIRSLVGSAGSGREEISEHLLLAVFMVLLAARSRKRTLIVHLYDLHWCTAAVIEFFETMIWQLDHICGRSLQQSKIQTGGLLFVFEGRTGERFSIGDTEWSTHTFESFVSSQNGPVASCRDFTDEESLEFVCRLFGDDRRAQERAPAPTLNLTMALAESIHAVAGGNPFHILEQVKYLRQNGILAQNRNTGLHYAVRPEDPLPELPPTVFEAIRARWAYLENTSPRVAQVVAAVALLSEQVPARLFRRLWRGIAPQHSLNEFEATGFLRIPPGDQAVSFHHENYFQSIRRMGFDRQAVQDSLDIYQTWFSSIGTPTAQQRYDWARILLESEVVDFKQVSKLLHLALRSATASQDNALACRILQCLLDTVGWTRPPKALARSQDFLRLCDKEIRLCQLLVSTGERQHAIHRADQLVRRIETRIASVARGHRTAVWQLHYRRIRAKIVKVRTLMNFGQPLSAVRHAASIANDFDAFKSNDAFPDLDRWRGLEMDACHAQAVALALNGEIDKSLQTAERAVSIARQMRPLTDSGLDAIGTYANILLAVSPDDAERLLRDCYNEGNPTGASTRTRIKIAINLAMSLLLQGYKAPDSLHGRRALKEAEQLVKPIFLEAFAGGRLADAAASALITGLVHAVRNSADESYWFAQSIDAANRGRQIETLWRAHFNLATSYRRIDNRSSERVQEHARAAAMILNDTLSPYSDPENSSRFSLVRLPLVEAVRFLVEANDRYGGVLLSEYPSLRRWISQPELGVVSTNQDDYSSHEWLRIGDFCYVLY